MIYKWGNKAAAEGQKITVEVTTEEKEAVIARVCPVCKRLYSARPAISRLDNETEICQDCGTMEALQAAGIPEESQKEILAAIQERRAAE